MWKKKKLVECIFMYMFNINISAADIYDIFDIHKLAKFTGGSSFFYFTENCFLVCHLLFMIDCLLFMIDFLIPHANFKFLFWLFSECLCRYLIKNIEENIHGYVLSRSVSNLDVENALTVSASKHFCLNEYVFSIFIYLIGNMINFLIELAIPN